MTALEYLKKFISHKPILLVTVVVVFLVTIMVIIFLLKPEIFDRNLEKDSTASATSGVKTYAFITEINKEDKTIQIIDSQTNKSYRIKISDQTELLENQKKVQFDDISSTSVTVISKTELEENSQNQVDQIWLAPAPKGL